MDVYDLILKRILYVSLIVACLTLLCNKTTIFRWGLCLFEVALEVERYFDLPQHRKQYEDLQSTYDYIIVGAGTAGCLIAAHLTEQTDATVLVVEAGSEPSFFQKVPAFSALFHGTAYDWRYKIEPQRSSCGAMNYNQCSFPLGRGVGGSNLLNNMIWHRGNESDYVGWFDDAHNYDYKTDIEPLFISLESKLGPNALAYRTKLGQLLSSHDAINNVKFSEPLVLQKYGKRYTPCDYAKAKCSSRTKFLRNALVRDINFEMEESVQATGVSFESNEKYYRISATKGVILSAGAIGTPKLLLESGIGPCDELEELGIKCIRNIPAVGKNLQDHIATGMSLFKYDESLGMDIYTLLQPQHVMSFLLPFNWYSGPLSTVGCEALAYSIDNKIGFMFMPADITADYGLKLRNVMNLKDSVWQQHFQPLLKSQTVSILPILLHPKSKGFVTLRKSFSHEFDAVINPQYLTDKSDVKEMIRGIKLIKSVVTQLSREANINLQFTVNQYAGCERLSDENDYWECYLRHMSFSIYHPVGTCRMGAMANDSSVVDRNFKVHGIGKLFIVDASVMPNLPSGNPNAAVALLSEKFLQIMKSTIKK